MFLFINNCFLEPHLLLNTSQGRLKLIYPGNFVLYYTIICINVFVADILNIIWVSIINKMKSQIGYIMSKLLHDAQNQKS